MRIARTLSGRLRFELTTAELIQVPAPWGWGAGLEFEGDPVLQITLFTQPGGAKGQTLANGMAVTFGGPEVQKLPPFLVREVSPVFGTNKATIQLDKRKLTTPSPVKRVVTKVPPPAQVDVQLLISQVNDLKDRMPGLVLTIDEAGYLAATVQYGRNV